MTETPAPLTPPDADLQDFAFMPLHVARLRDSDLAAEEAPEACWYAVLLWSASWHQLPAGSLPDNDTVLMRLCGLGRDQRTWRKFRDGALRGFVICADGRLYHPVVAEQVVESWKKKLEQRWRTECARIRKSNSRNNLDDPQPTFDEFVARDWPLSVPFVSQGQSGNVPSDAGGMSQGHDPHVTSETVSKRQGQGQGQGDSSSVPNGTGAVGTEPVAIDPAKLLFDSGVALLGLAGIAEAKARPILGKWRRAHGDEAVIAALGTAKREGAIDPVSFIEACLRGARNGNRNGSGDADGARGHRPNPALDLWRAGVAGSEADDEDSGEDHGTGGGAWPQVPAGGKH